MAKRREHILVSWVSHGHAAAPLLTVFADPDSELDGRIDKLVLCHRQAQDDDDDAEVLRKTRAQLEKVPEDKRPELVERPWRTTASPTDHRRILAFSKKVLSELRDAHPDAVIILHLSPGTKAMHAAWLILVHGGFIPGDVRLLQTTEQRHRSHERKALEWVSLPKETWAHIVRASPPPTSGEDADEAIWDPRSVVSPRGRATLAAVERWAPLPAPILMVGERGSGKTTLAHVIRARSPFRALGDKPWPVVVCGQFRANPGLARSELFGHAKGAYTDAKEAHVGILERVDNDTLFLDEIADLDRGTQRLLIAAIEGRDYQRLGETHSRTANFRLVAATNRAVSELIASDADDARPPDHRFGIDADFFDRISTFVLHIPPLRDRREDLPLLWRSALARCCRRAGLDQGKASPLANERAVLAALATHSLPGNLRDLQSAAWHGLAALVAGARPAAAAAEAIAGLDPLAGSSASRRAPADPGLPLDLAAYLQAEEHRILEAAMRRTGGNKARAAELVKLARKTFEYRLKKLAVSR